MIGLLQDVRFAFRQLRRNPGFTFVALLTLTLGMGANVVIFGMLNATLLRPISFPDSDRLVLVWEINGKRPNSFNNVSAPTYWEYARRNQVFESIAIFDSAGRGYNLPAVGAGGEPEQVSGLRVSASFFPTLGIHPYLGRTFLPEEESLGNDHEVVLSYGLWRRRYGGDRNLIGKAIRIDGQEFTVVGVMPPEFHWQFWSGQRELWVPVGYTAGDKNMGSHSFVSLARLKPGVTLEQARAEMANIGTGLAEQYPKTLTGESATVISLAEYTVRGIRTMMLTLFAAVGFVLLIVCVNVANLLLVRGAGRQKELAVRRALGATRSRIARQLITESLLLALLGSLCGLALAAWTLHSLPGMLPRSLLHIDLHELDRIPLDGHVLAFSFLVTGVTGVLFGLVPAVNAMYGGLTDALKERAGGFTGRDRLRRALVATEVALALIVLCGAGLMIESMIRLLRVDPGFDPERVLTMQMSLSQEALYNGPPSHPHFCRSLDERVGAIPGVAAVGAVAHLPLGGGASRSFSIDGRSNLDPHNLPGADYSVTCPGYFRTLNMPLLAGRDFSHEDIEGSPNVIVINQAMAQKLWPNESPIGRGIRLGITGVPLRVVGVVGSAHSRGLDSDVRPQFFRPYPQAGWPVMTVVVRTNGTPGSYVPAVKKALAEIEPERPVSDVREMRDIVDASLGGRRFPMILLATFGVISLVLAAVGIAGVVSYSVTQRTREIGIRMALGARTFDVLQLVLRGSMASVFAGVVCGLLGSIGLTRLLGSLLFQVKPSNPIVPGIVSLLLFSVASLASYLPARRAAKIEPVTALRQE
jgi:putative ABC transport system permease protein